MMKKTLLVLAVAVLAVLQAQAQGRWKTLFDGKSTKNFRGYGIATFPDCWRVEDGALATIPNMANRDLVTKASYTNFELEFEWRVSKAGNSGVFWHMKEDKAMISANGNSPNWLDNYEYQVLDDIDFYDKKPSRSAGALYDLITPNASKTLKPVGQYNTARIVVKGNHIEHWLNGTKVLEFENNSPAMNALLADSKFKTNPTYGQSAEGLVMFQHHGQQVWYRNIRIRKL
jgi:hypothetical protein